MTLILHIWYPEHTIQEKYSTWKLCDRSPLGMLAKSEKKLRDVNRPKNVNVWKIYQRKFNFLLFEICVYKNMNMKSAVVFLRRKLKVQYRRFTQRAGFSYFSGTMQEAGSIAAWKLILSLCTNPLPVRRSSYFNTLNPVKVFNINSPGWRIFNKGASFRWTNTYKF